MSYPPSIQNLIRAFLRLPGVGPKTAERYAIGLLRRPRAEISALSDALRALGDAVMRCAVCGNFGEQSPCTICADPKRDRATICVIAEPQDLAALERTGEYKGQYHLLGGVINAVEGAGPEDLSIAPLIKRLGQGEFHEVILALDATIEGESTAIYIAKILKPMGVRTTRLARGLPMGSNVEFADEVTLTNALHGRREM